MKLKFLEKTISKIDTKTKVLAILALVEKAKVGMQKCKEHKNSMIDRSNLGFVIMSLESGLKSAKKNPSTNQEVIKLLEGLTEWGTETIKAWKEEKWEEIDFELWQEVIDYFLGQAATLQNKQIASDVKQSV
jgi:hypothetical protein